MMRSWLAGLGGSVLLVGAAVVTGLVVLAFVRFDGGDSTRVVPGKVGRLPIPGPRAADGHVAFLRGGAPTSRPGTVPARRHVSRPQLSGKRHGGRHAPVDTPQLPKKEQSPASQPRVGGDGPGPVSSPLPPTSGSGGGSGQGNPGPGDPGEGSQSPPGLGQTISDVGQNVGNTVNQTTQSVGGALGNNPVGNTVAGTGETIGNTISGLTGTLGGALGG